MNDFLQWLAVLTLFVLLLAGLTTLVDRLEERWRARHPRPCELCRSYPRRPGDVLCWTCWRFLARYPRPEQRDAA